MSDETLILVANPHYYDNLHDIRISGDNCTLVDGGDQSVKLEVHGKVKIIEGQKMQFSVSGLITGNVLQDFTIPFRIEDGRWIFKQEVMWKQAKETHPVCIATRRYVFDLDPIMAVSLGLNGDLTVKSLKDGEENPADRIYYELSTIQRYVPMNTLTQEDLTLIENMSKDHE